MRTHLIANGRTHGDLETGSTASNADGLKWPQGLSGAKTIGFGEVFGH